MIVSAKELPQDVSEALIDGDMYHCPLLTRFLTTAEAAAAAREEREGNEEEDDDDDDDDEMITVAPVVALLYLRHGLFLLPLPVLCHR